MRLEPPRVVHRDETFALVVRDRLLVPCWWNAPTAAQMDVMAQEARAMARRHPDGTAFIQFVLEGVPRFSNEVRASAERLTKEHFDIGIAHVIELGGLAGAATRAFLSGLALVSRSGKPLKVFDDPQTAARWVAERLVGAGHDGWRASAILEARAAAIDARAPVS